MADKHFTSIPAPKIILEVPAEFAHKARRQHRLYWTDEHAASQHGIGVLLDQDGLIFDAQRFAIWRDIVHARILTDDPFKVCRALDLPQGSAGIEEIPESFPFSVLVAVGLAAFTVAAAVVEAVCR
jgi:hypothetical protein